MLFKDFFERELDYYYNTGNLSDHYERVWQNIITIIDDMDLEIAVQVSKNSEGHDFNFLMLSSALVMYKLCDCECTFIDWVLKNPAILHHPK